MDWKIQKTWFDSDAFQAAYHCEQPLGAFCGEDGTRFRLWAPTAGQVLLNLYDAGEGGGPRETVPLRRGEQGLWLYETDRNLDGTYYDYDVTVDGVCRRTGDPYARACGKNGRRSMVLDFKRTAPDGWQSDHAPAPAPETVIYELHVKDFSWDSHSGIDRSHRGRYKAFSDGGTTLDGDGVHPTAMAYLQRLGVTHVQLMPVFDFGSVDEGDPDQFNWGYDPVNYNVPEGSYATDPDHGEVRVKELKEAVLSLHRHGFRVIMDVVYNHTYHLDSCLWRTVPWYFYRQNEDGTPSNGSGCGSELATERSMCQRYILDSVLYWAEEYHMDGFRFDLMGLLDTELMNAVQAALDQRFGPGEKLVYGEPWGAAGSSVRPGTVLCTKDNLRRLNPNIGAFCDNTRDAVKGSLWDAGMTGFVNGGGLRAEALRPCLCGWSEGWGAFVQAPSQTITYLSCHDDWTLWDKLVYTLDPEKRFSEGNDAVLQSNFLAAALLFSCQGRLFLHAGEEFGRTKDGSRNTYCAPPEVNRLDWRRAWQRADLADYYRGLIALRQRLPGLCDKSPRAFRRFRSVEDLGPDFVFVTVDNRGGPDGWDTLLLCFNASGKAQTVALPAGTWQVLAGGRDSFLWKKREFQSGAVSVPPVSALILGGKEPV